MLTTLWIKWFRVVIDYARPSNYFLICYFQDFNKDAHEGTFMVLSWVVSGRVHHYFTLFIALCFCFFGFLVFSFLILSRFDRIFSRFFKGDFLVSFFAYRSHSVLIVFSKIGEKAFPYKIMVPFSKFNFFPKRSSAQFLPAIFHHF